MYYTRSPFVYTSTYSVVHSVSPARLAKSRISKTRYFPAYDIKSRRTSSHNIFSVGENVVIFFVCRLKGLVRDDLVVVVVVVVAVQFADDGATGVVHVVVLVVVHHVAAPTPAPAVRDDVHVHVRDAKRAAAAFAAASPAGGRRRCGGGGQRRPARHFSRIAARAHVQRVADAPRVRRAAETRQNRGRDVVGVQRGRGRGRARVLPAGRGGVRVVHVEQHAGFRFAGLGAAPFAAPGRRRRGRLEPPQRTRPELQAAHRGLRRSQKRAEQFSGTNPRTDR